MNSLIETLNRLGGRIPDFAWPMLWQSSVLIVVLFVFDFAARRKVRASVRYALWLVVLVKLLLPPTLALPTSLAWWVRSPTPQPKAQPRTTEFVVTYGDFVPANFSTPAPPVLAPPPKLSLSSAGWSAAAWAVVGAGLLAWLIGRWRKVAGDVRKASVAPESLNEVVGEAQHCIKLPRRVGFLVTKRAMSPAVCGLFRPVILLPQSLVDRLTTTQLRAVLLHELTHVRRGDVWVNCIQALLQIFYWWHPLLWLANARIRRVREEAVDDAVMLALADDRETYAPTLLEVAKLAFNRPLASLGLVGILESRSALRQRIERLVDFRAPRKAGLTVASAFCVVAFAALAVPMEKAPATSATQVSTQKQTESASHPPVEISNENVFSVKGPEVDPMLTRVFQLDAKKLSGWLQDDAAIPQFSVNQGPLLLPGVDPQEMERTRNPGTLPPDLPQPRERGGLSFITRTNQMHAMSVAMSTFFSTVGVDLASPSALAQGKAMFWKDRTGTLLVRATKQDLDTIERALAALARGVTGSSSLSPQLQTRSFNVNPSNDAALRELLAKLGMNLSSANYFWSTQTGELVVRDQAQNLDFIERGIKALASSPTQINIKVRFAEITRGDVKAVGFDWYLGNLLLAKGTISNSTPQSLQFQGVLTDPQFRVVLRALEQRDGVDLLAGPEVTTASGRQAQIQIVEMKTVVTGINPHALSTNGGTNGVFQTQVLPFGPSLDVIPYVATNGYQIQMTVIPAVTEFLGYDDPALYGPTNSSGQGNQPTLPLPRFRSRQMTVTAIVRDGQTLVLANPTAIETFKKRDGTMGTNDVTNFQPKQLIVFITPTLVDSTGNRLRKDDEPPSGPK